MNVLMLNGSPRRDGNISRMLDTMQEEAENRGMQVTLLRVSALQVQPCRGCMSCRGSGTCILPEDGAQYVLDRIRACDVLIIGAPCYWGNMPGQLKVLFDRMVYGMMGESSKGIPVPLHKGKRAVLVSTCTTPYPFNILFNQTRGVIKALREILKWSGFKVVSCLECGGTKKHPVSGNVLERCRKAVRKF